MESIKPADEKYVEAETVSEDSEFSSLSNFTDAVSEKTDFSSSEIILIEPFYGGSHKQLIDTLCHHLNENFPSKKFVLYSLPAKKWHWRARTSALYFYETIPKSSCYRVLLCSSVLNLAELVALRPDLLKLFKVIYFHENQLVYPIRKAKERDFQYGYNQILSALVADVVVFNSHYNMNLFLSSINGFIKIQPDFRIKNLDKKIAPKCKVIYFPVEVMNLDIKKGDVLHIIWPHRWEHDKNPELFFEVLFKLKSEGISFLLSILGESFNEVPEIFEKAKKILVNEIIHFGWVPSKSEYYQILSSGHVVVSTANHEFFGVAMVEAVLCGCYPIACNSLVYPEIYPPHCLYNTPNQLYKKLKTLCQRPYLAEKYLKDSKIDLEKVNPFMDGINKVKELIQELEESFHESSNIGNNLILRCVLLRAENQNLVYKIDERNRNLSTIFFNKNWRLSVLSQKKYKAFDRNSSSNGKSEIICPSQSKPKFHNPVPSLNAEEIEILHETIEDLQKKLRERDKKIETLCQKYLSLKTSKSKMENDLKSKILSLEKQLDVTYNILNEFRNEVEEKIGKNMSVAENMHEALFLQEKLRCSKLMYEKVKLNHEIKRLEDCIRRLGAREGGEKGCWEMIKCSVDKCNSEPLMKRF